MHIPKYNSEIVFCFLVFLYFTLDLSDPIVFYDDFFVNIPSLLLSL